MLRSSVVVSVLFSSDEWACRVVVAFATVERTAWHVRHVTSSSRRPQDDLALTWLLPPIECTLHPDAEPLDYLGKAAMGVKRAVTHCHCWLNTGGTAGASVSARDWHIVVEPVEEAT